MTAIWLAIREWWSNRNDATFEGLSWQGWHDPQCLAIETHKVHCQDAVFLLTQSGYLVTGINRSARLIHISMLADIAKDVPRPYNSRAPLEGLLQPQMRNCTHGKD